MERPVAVQDVASHRLQQRRGHATMATLGPSQRYADLERALMAHL